MTRTLLEHSYKRLSKGEIGEWMAAAADQRNLIATVSIAGVMKLAQAHYVLAKTVHPILHKDLPLSGSRPTEQSNCFNRR
jgi:hypothetical protein